MRCVREELTVPCAFQVSDTPIYSDEGSTGWFDLTVWGVTDTVNANATDEGFFYCYRSHNKPGPDSDPPLIPNCLRKDMFTQM